MGFHCPKCKNDFGCDRIAFNEHLKEENVSSNIMDLVKSNLMDIVNDTKGLTGLSEETNQN